MNEGTLAPTSEASISDVEHEAGSLNGRPPVTFGHLLLSCFDFFPSIFFTFDLLCYQKKTATVSFSKNVRFVVSWVSLDCETYLSSCQQPHSYPWCLFPLRRSYPLAFLFLCPSLLLPFLHLQEKKYDECYTPHKPASSVSVSLKSKGVALPYQLIKFPFLFWPDFSSLTSVSCFVVCFVSSLPSSCTFFSSVVAAGLSVVSFFSSSFRSLSSLPSVFWPGDAFCDEES